MELQGRVAVVTGANGGLGRRIAHTLAEQSAHVVVVYRQNAEAAESVAAELRAVGSGQVLPIAADVTDEQAVKSLVASVIERFGRLDVLVNNAAHNQWIPFSDLDALTPQVWELILRTNATGPFLCIRTAAPYLKHAGGAVVNIASAAGLFPGGSSMAYAVSKAALIHLTRCMAVALAPDVTVNCVAPGLMEGTRMADRLAPEYRERIRSGAALKRATDMDDVAEQVLTFVRSRSTTGQTVVIDAGIVYH